MTTPDAPDLLMPHEVAAMNPPGCDSPSPATWGPDGKCRCLVCARCGHHTGNGHQGHYWAYCTVTGTTREFHFCCPDDCELGAPEVAVTP